MQFVRPLALAVAALTVSALGVGVADAAPAATKHNVKASIHLNGSKSKLQGAISSGADDCTKKVVVTLHWLAPHTKKYEKVATDTTNKSGAWTIHAPGTKIPSGKYYATTAASKDCASAASKRITV